MSSTETIIVGGGLTGLFLAHRLHRGGHTVTLLEARENLGGRYARASHTYSSPGLDFIPASREHIVLLEWLRNVSPIPISFEAVDHRPQLFDEGKWRPFAGFGESGFQSVGELSALFSHTQGLNTKPGLEHLVRALVEQLPVAAQTMSTVTGFKVTDGKISEVTVNGDKILKATNIIFTAHPSALGNLFQGEELPVKHRTRLAKMPAWTSVTLELGHSPQLVDDSSVRFFTHSAKEFEPVVGRVFGETSKWLTLVPGDREADHEFVSQCIRHIKRQLKRAWPLALEGHALGEKIYIQPGAYGQFNLRGKEALRFPEISNLYLANHALASLPGDLAALETVQTLESELLGPLNQLPEITASC